MLISSIEQFDIVEDEWTGGPQRATQLMARGRSVLSELERRVVQIALVEGNVPLHASATSTVTERLTDWLHTTITGTHRKGPLGSAHLEALRHFVARMREADGAMDRDELYLLLQAGFDRVQVFEIVLLVAAATLKDAID
jgi:alkylhydroperoxidase family enzyme